MQSVERRVVIVIEHNPTACTNVCPKRQQFLDDRATVHEYRHIISHMSIYKYSFYRRVK